MRRFILSALILLLCGCTFPERTSIPKEESFYKATFITNMTRKQAFDAIEVDLVRTYNNAKNVTQVKQPENGRIVVQALTREMVIQDIPMAPILGHVPYILDVQIADNSIVFYFEVTGPCEHKTTRVRADEYPADMRPVLIGFKETAESLAKSIGGTLKSESAIPKPAPKPAPKTTDDQ